MAQTIVVIGGALGGPIAAARAREFDEEARIVLVEKRPHVSWVQAGLRHHIEGHVKNLAALDKERAEFFAARHRIEVRTSTEAVRLDVDARRVVLRTEQGTETLRFDAAIYSGGAEFQYPDVDGLKGPGVSSFRTLDDLQALRAALEKGAKKALVVGCGAWGLDAAEAFCSSGLEVDVVDKADRILPKFSVLAARAAARELTSRGIRLHLADELVKVEPYGDQGRRVTLRSGRVIEADVVVIATRFRPRTKLLEEAGASLNADGSLRVDAHMQTTLPNVFACGHAVSTPHAVTRKPVWLPHASTATRTAQIAGRNAAVGEGGRKESLSAVAGTALVQVGETYFGRTGLSDAEARVAFGEDRVLSITIHGYSAEPWLGGDPLSVRMVVDKKAQVVVGGEAWGKVGVPRRVDILAAAVLESWSPWRVADLDIAYASNLGSAPDPVNLSGHLAGLTLTGEARPIEAERLLQEASSSDPPVIVDVGRTSERDRGVWPAGTRHIPLESLREHMGELPRDRRVVLVSHTGQRAHTGYRVLRQHGFENVEHLDGGALSFSLTRSP